MHAVNTGRINPSGVKQFIYPCNNPVVVQDVNLIDK